MVKIARQIRAVCLRRAEPDKQTFPGQILSEPHYSAIITKVYLKTPLRKAARRGEKGAEALPDSHITKRALAAAMKELMEEHPFQKITVADICERCDMNRKSFYYHFKDKYDLVNWIYDTEFIAAALGKTYDSQWTRMEDICKYFYENRGFYCRVLDIEGQNSFSEHFREMILPVFAEELREELQGVLGEQKALEFHVIFFTDAFICSLKRWLRDKDCMPPEEFVALLHSCVNLGGDL